MDLKTLKDKKLVIWGAGKEGFSALRWLRRFYADQPITILTDSEIPGARKAEFEPFGNLRFKSGQATPEILTQADVVIKSPGISLYRDDLNGAKKSGTKFTSTANLWLAAMGTDKTIGVTGTKGKSTTASLIYHIFKELGISAALGGNIGTPLLDLWDQKEAIDIWVIEFSSYQTADLHHHPDIALLLNLYPEHIDWHLNIDNYFRDKLNLFKPDSHHTTILNFNDPQTRKMTAEWQTVTYFGAKHQIHVKGDTLYDAEQPLGLVQNPDLAGDHNLANVCAAMTAVKTAGFDPEKATAALDSFKSLPHRQQILGRKDGLLFVDDSISTTPETAMAAVDRFGDTAITLILGGYDRRQSYDTLTKHLLTKKVHAVITIPDNGSRIARNIIDTVGKQRSSLRLAEADSLAAAVAAAKQLTPKGGTVLLSPAAPSYGRFKSYIERGLCFAKAAGFEVSTKR